MVLRTGQMISGYQVLGALGAGAMGEVYRARDARLGRDVALKVLPAEFVDDEDRLRRFEREAQVLASVNHPNIAAIYKLEEESGIQLLVLELVEGVALDQLLRKGPVPVDETLKIGRQVARALEAAHEKGIVHRDLKPANVMLGPKGVAKVLDFGLARAPQVEADERESMPRDPSTGNFMASALEARLTVAGAVMGTVPYMSPEQVRGRDVDKRSDIWSFGCLLFELLTGSRPFTRATTAETLTAILEQEPQWSRLPASTPPVIDKLLRRCLQKDANERLHDIADARIEIDELERLKSSTTVPVRSAPLQWPRALAGVVAVGVLLVTLLVLFRPSSLEEGSHLEDIASVLALPSTVTLVGAGEKSLFEDPGDSQAFDFLADAVPATLSERLGALGDLETRLPLAKLKFESIDGDLGTLAHLYGVDAFLTSEVEVNGDEFAVRLELIDTDTRSLLWSGDFQGTRAAYLELMRDAASGLMGALRPNAEQSAGDGYGLTADSAAELALREGAFFASTYEASRNGADFDRAKVSFVRALERDAGLADAAAAIALLHVRSLDLGAPPAEAWEEIEEWATRARAIDPKCGLALSILSGVDNWYHREEPRGRHLEYLLSGATLGAKASHPHAFLGVGLGEYSLSLGAEALRRATDIDPLYVIPRMNMIGCLATVGRAREALKITEQAERIDLLRPLVLLNKALTLSMLGRTQEARPILDQLEGMVADGHLPPFMLYEPRLEYEMATKDSAAVEALIQEMRGMIASPETPGALTFSFVIACSSALAAAGDVDGAFEILGAGEAGGVLLPYDYLVLNPRLESLRSDPRYPEATASSRTRFEEMLAVLAKAREQGELPAYLEGPLADLLERIALVQGSDSGD